MQRGAADDNSTHHTSMRLAKFRKLDLQPLLISSGHSQLRLPPKFGWTQAAAQVCGLLLCSQLSAQTPAVHTVELIASPIAVMETLHTAVPTMPTLEMSSLAQR